MNNCNLLEVSEDEKKAILDHYNLTEEELNENIKRIIDWRYQAGCNYEDFLENKTRNILFNCKMSMEKTKACIKGYYKIRSLCCDFMDRTLPFSDDYNESKKYTSVVILPRLTPDLCRVHILKVNDIEGAAIDGLIYTIISLMQFEIRFACKDFFMSNIIVVDLEQFNFKNLIKVTPYACQTIVHILVGLNVRLKSFHFINAHPITDKLMLIVKTFFPSKLVNKMRTHTGYETLYEYVPQKMLPSDYNGGMPSLEKLHEQWCKCIEEKEEDYKKLLDVKNHTPIESNGESADVFGMGWEGSFKKLNID